MKTFMRQFKYLGLPKKVCLVASLVLVVGLLVTGLVVATVEVIGITIGIGLCLMVAYAFITVLDMYI